jgi:hypothetical protein
MDGRADEAVAADDKPETVPRFLEISSGHCRIY